MKTQHGRDLTGAEMAQMLDEFINGASVDSHMKEFAEQITDRTHRTLQQAIMRAFLLCIERWAAAPHYDLRNAATVLLCRKFIAATGDKYDRFLPYV